MGKREARKIMDKIRTKESQASESEAKPTGRPLVSYITVSYNSGNSIEETIKSVSSCKRQFPCEHIIIDSNSNDNTEQILRQNSQVIDLILREPDHGIYDAMNKGVRLARGDYVCFVNADDRIILQGAVKVAKLLRDCHRHLDIVASAALAVEGNTETLWLPSALDRFLVFRCPDLCHNGVYAHRSVFQRVGDFDSSLQIAADSDWIIRAVRSRAKVKVVGTPTVYYSIGGMSSDTSHHAKEMLLIAKKTYPLLRPEVIQSLFFHLFAWQDRRTLFTAQRPLSLADSLREAQRIYPELSYWSYLLNGVIHRKAAKALGRLKQTLRAGDS